MWPPLLMLDPPCAKSALDYRWNRREGAHIKATVCGTPNHASSGGQGALDLPYDALMFPWESCLTGHEVQFVSLKSKFATLVCTQSHRD
jgi:trehalose/maltose hydrolase-like predicted phosphorylase